MLVFKQLFTFFKARCSTAPIKTCSGLWTSGSGTMVEHAARLLKFKGLSPAAAADAAGTRRKKRRHDTQHNYTLTTPSIITLSIMTSNITVIVVYIECHVFLILLCWVSLCWLSLSWMSWRQNKCWKFINTNNCFALIKRLTSKWSKLVLGPML